MTKRGLKVNTANLFMNKNINISVCTYPPRAGWGGGVSGVVGGGFEVGETG